MSDLDLPLILEPEVLEPLLGREGLVVVDLSRADVHEQYHIPGAVFIDYSEIVASEPPINGLLPPITELERLFSVKGIGNDSHVVAYDDEGGGKAARLLWTLEVLGHSRCSLLNGGLHAWANEGHPLVAEATLPRPANFKAQYSTDPVADAGYILDNLDSPTLALLDARSAEEYEGFRCLADRAGHIPGAVNWDWVQLMDPSRNQRLKHAAALQQALLQRGITKDKTVVTYCQTHHRSSLTYVALKSLGYQHLKGYPGSWSDWGNRDDTPVED